MPASENDANPSTPPSRQRTTSAKRLLTLLALAKVTNGANAYRVFPASMGIKSTPEMVELGWSYAECMVLIAKMLGDFELEVSASGLNDEEKTFHMECRHLVINAIAPVRLSVPWDQAKAHISETLISKLQNADVALKRSVTEQMLVVADLQELRASIKSALLALTESDLPVELKAFISMHLVRIQTALDEYEFRGSAGLQDALAGYLGSLGMGKEQIAQQATEPQKRQLKDVLLVANATITLAHGAAWVGSHLAVGLTLLAGLLGM